ncbi:MULTISPECIES: hypothetical protein [Bacillus]|uniref:hypothetical protein n=1 Tax=Bacillus TaxID=1386 RepID=UPI000B438FB5|nr:hypothetical protein [Bacillus pumilus]OUZ11632.1 hypothetical protein BHE94_04165 [Bacillus pumilus]
MRKKIICSTLSALVAFGVLSNSNIASASTEKTYQSATHNVTVEELSESGKIQNANLENNVYSVTYNKNGKLYDVEYNGNTENVTINGKIQEGISYEYNPQLANSNNNSEISTSAAKPKSGYKYVGTSKGHTKEVTSAASLYMKLALLIPGAGWGINSVRVLLVYTDHNLDKYIPQKYYKYDLYQKGFMTDKWYQYTTTRLYNDKKYKKPSGKAWTSNPKRVDLPNS